MFKVRGTPLDYASPRMPTDEAVLNLAFLPGISERERKNVLIAFAALQITHDETGVLEVYFICARPADDALGITLARAAIQRGGLPDPAGERFDLQGDNWILYSVRATDLGAKLSIWCAVEVLDPYELWDCVSLIGAYETPELLRGAQLTDVATPFTISVTDLIKRSRALQ
jgi:hypothetical protein